MEATSPSDFFKKLGSLKEEKEYLKKNGHFTIVNLTTYTEHHKDYQIPYQTHELNQNSLCHNSKMPWLTAQIYQLYSLRYKAFPTKICFMQTENMQKENGKGLFQLGCYWKLQSKLLERITKVACWRDARAGLAALLLDLNDHRTGTLKHCKLSHHLDHPHPVSECWLKRQLFCFLSFQRMHPWAMTAQMFRVWPSMWGTQVELQSSVSAWTIPGFWRHL